VGETAFVVIRIPQGRRLAEAGGGANDALVEHPPVARPHEGLVVKTRRQKARKDIVDSPHVEIQRRPTILTGRREPVEELDGGGAQVRLLAIGFSQRDERVGLLDAGAEDAAAAMVLEAASHHPDTVGKQRRRQGVARKARVGAAVEAKGHGPIPIDEAALELPEGLAAHGDPSSTARPGGAEPSTS